MLLSGKNTIEEGLNSIIDFEYHKLEEEENWKVNMLVELIDLLTNEQIIEDLETDDFDEIVEFLCTG